MKFICALSGIIAFACSASAQLSAKAPLKNIVNDAANEFQSYKGVLKSAGEGDSVYHSTALLDGSKEAEIEFLTGRLVQYHAYLSDSATKKEARALVEKWKDKIATAVPDYQRSKINYTTGRRKTTGYLFSKELVPAVCSVSIVYSKKEIDDYYWVLLTVTRQAKEVKSSGENREE